MKRGKSADFLDGRDFSAEIVGDEGFRGCPNYVVHFRRLPHHEEGIPPLRSILASLRMSWTSPSNVCPTPLRKGRMSCSYELQARLSFQKISGGSAAKQFSRT